MTSTEAELKASIGGLAANIVQAVFSDVSGLEDILAGLRQGQITQAEQRKIQEYLRQQSPTVRVAACVDQYLAHSAAQQARSHLSRADYEGFMQFLCNRIRPEDVLPENVYGVNISVVAKRMVGAPLTCFFSPGSLEAGVITAVGVYTGEGDGQVNFPKTWLPNQVPGTIGKWHSPTRQAGGYDVAAIASHEPGKEGYIAFFGVTVSNQRLGMREIAEKFGFTQLEGDSLLNPKCQIKVGLRSNDTNDITSDIRVRKLTNTELKKKGVGCIDGYELDLRPPRKVY